MLFIVFYHIQITESWAVSQLEISQGPQKALNQLGISQGPLQTLNRVRTISVQGPVMGEYVFLDMGIDRKLNWPYQQDVRVVFLTLNLIGN